MAAEVQTDRHLQGLDLLVVEVVLDEQSHLQLASLDQILDHV